MTLSSVTVVVMGPVVTFDSGTLPCDLQKLVLECRQCWSR